MAKKLSSRKMGININEISSSRFAALIPAAGYSSRMGFFKPLLPLGKSLAIARTVDTFRQAGLEDIRVITGYKQELLTPVLNRLGVTVLTNPGFSAGMYSSIQAGVSTLEDAIDAFFLLPGDCPLVKPGTIHALMAAYLRDPSSVIYPVYEGRRGHPPLLCARLRRLIAEHSPENGLNSLLEDYIHDFREVPVERPQYSSGYGYGSKPYENRRGRARAFSFSRCLHKAARKCWHKPTHYPSRTRSGAYRRFDSRRVKQPGEPCPSWSRSGGRVVARYSQG